MLAGLYQGSSYSDRNDARASSRYLMEGFDSEEQAWYRYRVRLLGQLDRYPVRILDWHWATREVRGYKDHMVPMRTPNKDDRVVLFEIEEGFIAKKPFAVLDARYAAKV